MIYMDLLEREKIFSVLIERNVFNTQDIRQIVDNLSLRINSEPAKNWFKSQFYKYLINDYNEAGSVKPITSPPPNAPAWFSVDKEFYMVVPSSIMLEQAREVIDYVNNLIEENPNTQVNLPFEEAIRLSREWHKTLIQNMNKKEDQIVLTKSEQEGTVVKLTFPDGYKWVDITSKICLKREGNRMGHCVGGYFNDIKKGEFKVYSLRDPNNEPHATLSFHIEQDTSNNTTHANFDQLKGKQNRGVNIKYSKYCIEFLNLLKNNDFDFMHVNNMNDLNDSFIMYKKQMFMSNIKTQHPPIKLDKGWEIIKIELHNKKTPVVLVKTDKDVFNIIDNTDYDYDYSPIIDFLFKFNDIIRYPTRKKNYKNITSLSLTDHSTLMLIRDAINELRKIPMIANDKHINGLLYDANSNFSDDDFIDEPFTHNYHEFLVLDSDKNIQLNTDLALKVYEGDNYYVTSYRDARFKDVKYWSIISNNTTKVMLAYASNANINVDNANIVFVTPDKKEQDFYKKVIIELINAHIVKLTTSMDGIKKYFFEIIYEDNIKTVKVQNAGIAYISYKDKMVKIVERRGQFIFNLKQNNKIVIKENLPYDGLEIISYLLHKKFIKIDVTSLKMTPFVIVDSKYLVDFRINLKLKITVVSNKKVYKTRYIYLSEFASEYASVKYKYSAYKYKFILYKNLLIKLIKNKQLIYKTLSTRSDYDINKIVKNLNNAKIVIIPSYTNFDSYIKSAIKDNIITTID